MQHPAEDSLAGHDAVAHPLEDLTMAVAFLAYLGNLEEDVSGLQPCAHGQLVEGNALCYDIFSKVSEFHLTAPAAEVLYFLKGQKAHLSVPVAGVGIALDTVFRDK